MLLPTFMESPCAPIMITSSNKQATDPSLGYIAFPWNGPSHAVAVVFSTNQVAFTRIIPPRAPKLRRQLGWGERSSRLTIWPGRLLPPVGGLRWLPR
ncbi:hypothetical protein LIA77_03440 [Sarocladium implicatum]|nr:hypothetical protein LIA77_03440 [Sarocladium implicatum]